MFSFSTGYFIKEIENIFSVLSYRNTCEKNLEIAVELLTVWASISHCDFPFSQFTLVFL